MISGRTTWRPIAGDRSRQSGPRPASATTPRGSTTWAWSIFAGQSPTTFYNDLWAYDPAADRWRELPAGGDAPVARYGSCAAIGPDGRLWISHGFTSEGSRFADTRAYDFTTHDWSDETPAGERPVERCLHGCWWTDDGRLALYAGQTTGVPALGDLWQLTPGPRIGTNAWSEVDAGSTLAGGPAAVRVRPLGSGNGRLRRRVAERRIPG